jgi:hypothetical protein
MAFHGWSMQIRGEAGIDEGALARCEADIDAIEHHAPSAASLIAS